MLIVDTDHLSELDRETSRGAELKSRLFASGVQVGTTVVSVEEQLRGFLAS